MKKILIDLAIGPERVQQLRQIPGVSVAVLPASDVPVCPEGPARESHILLGRVPRNLADMASLEWIQLASSGYGQAINVGLPERGIRVCNASGVFDAAIAEWNLAMMINLTRDFRSMVRNQESGTWDRSARFQREIRGLTAGFWGYGGTARETARLLKAMGVRVHVLVREKIRARLHHFVLPGTGDAVGALPDRTFGHGERDEFLSGLDFLILAVPLTRSTTGMVGPAELKKLPRRCFLLNPARGPIVQEQALVTALQEQWIAGAALDAHFHYPMPPGHPLWSMSNVIMTPHISGSDGNPHYLERLWDLFLENVRRSLSGEPLLNQLSDAQLRGD